MLYQDYKAKINRRVKIRKILRKYRVPIICTISAILMLFTAFAITKGMVFGDSLELNKIEYGNKPSFTANAVFSDVRYEFCSASGGEWSTEVPVHMGEYKMRVVASGLFGERFSEEQSFSIVPRNIYVVANEKTITYGEKPTAAASMAFDDKVYCGEFVFDDTTQLSTTVTPVKNTITIKDKNGKDVTHCYNVMVKSSGITFTPRDIVITVESKETTYDGKFFSHEVWDVTGGSLAYTDDVVKVIDGSFPTIIGVGSTANKGEFKVERNGVDVSHHYNITQIEGTLTINKRPVVMITPDHDFIYDGTEKYDLEFWESEDTSLLKEKGHYATISDIIARLTPVGEIENKHEYTIRDKDDNNVTDNYSITHVTGKLRVLPRPVTVKTNTESATYTGEEISFKGYTVVDTSEEIEGLAVGHSFKILSFTKATNAIENLENVMELDIVDGNGESVIKNYDLIYEENGTVTIRKKKIEITSVDLLDGIYNGKPQGAETANYDEAELIEGHSIKFSMWSSVTDCLDEPVDNDFGVTIFDGEQKPVTDNYEIVKHLGKLQLMPLTINILTNSADKIYDGEELSAPGYTYVEGSAEFVKGHTVECVESTIIVNAETVANEIRLEITQDGVDKSFNYIVNATLGELRIDKRSITVSSKGFDTLVYYDGEKHRRDGKDAIEVTSQLGFALIDGHEVRVDFLDGSYVDTAIQEVENRFNVIGVFIENTETSVTRNYTIESTFGVLRLEKRPVAFISGSMPTDEANRVIYNGEAHDFKECDVIPVDENNLVANMGLVSGHTPYGSDYSMIIDAEEIDNEFVVTNIYDAEGNSVFDNYEITGYQYGKLKVFPRPIILISDSDQKVYDGTALTKTDGFEIGGAGLPTTQYFDVTSYASITDVLLENGQVIGVPNTFEYVIRWNGSEIEVPAKNFEVIGTDYGTLTVTKRPITVTTYDAEKMYDGVPLANKTANITVGTMAENQVIEYINYATLTDVLLDGGRVVSLTNSCSYVIHWFSYSGATVSLTNYEITEDFGELLVTKRPVTLEIISQTKEYDATPLKPNGFITEEWYSLGGILDTHVPKMNLWGEITLVGSVGIEHEIPTIVDGSQVSKTDNYEITVIDGSLTVTVRNVGITASGDTVEYTGYEINPVVDGNNVYHTDAYGNQIPGAGLGDGDYIEYVSFIYPIGPELGSYEVKIDENSIVIFNKNEEDVTYCYDIRRVISDYIEVIRRKIKINVLNGYKEYYDGAPVVSQGYTVDNFLYELHTIDMVILGEQINVTTDPVTGEKNLGVAYVKDGSLEILDKAGNDASKYYDVEKTTGTLEVEKRRPIRITSPDAMFPYTGEDQPYNQYTLEDLCSSPMQREEAPDVVFNGKVPNLPGSYSNSFTVEMYVVNDTSIITTPNYEIDAKFGNIIIGKIKITVTTEGATKVYDGAKLTNPNATYVCEAQATIPGLVIEIVTTGEQTDVIKGDFGIFGGSKNTYEIRATIDGVPLPKEAFDDTDSEMGDLIVTPLELVVHSDSKEGFREEVGALFGESVVVGWEGSEAEKNLTLSIGQVVLTTVDRKKNEPTITLEKNGEKVPRDNYKISDESIFGMLTMRTNNLIIIESESEEFVYDGTPKLVNWTKSSNINSNHYIKTSGYSEFVDVGEHENTFFIVDIYSRETGESVLDLYTNIKTVSDYVVIKKREITIIPPSIVESADDYDIMYAPDRIVLPNEDLDALNKNYYGYVYDYEIDWSMVSERPYVAGVDEILYQIPKECIFITLNGERLPQENFIINNEQYGRLKLSDKLLEIGIPKYAKVYDGQWHGYGAKNWWCDDLPEGYYLDLDISSIGLTEVGTVDLDEALDTLLRTRKLVLYYGNEEVTDEFDYKFVCEKPLTVKKIEIDIVADSARAVYEQGKTLTCNKYKLEGTLFEGHKIETCTVVGSISGVGKEDNRITYVKIVDENGDDVTHLYDINRVEGSLELFEE